MLHHLDGLGDLGDVGVRLHQEGVQPHGPAPVQGCGPDLHISLRTVQQPARRRVAGSGSAVHKLQVALYRTDAMLLVQALDVLFHQGLVDGGRGNQNKGGGIVPRTPEPASPPGDEASFPPVSHRCVQQFPDVQAITEFGGRYGGGLAVDHYLDHRFPLLRLHF